MKNKSRTNKWIPFYGLTLLALLMSGIGVAKAIGVWATTGVKETVVLTGVDVNEIKGWMPLKEVLDTYQLDQVEVYTKFKIPESIPVDTPLKDIAAQTDETFSPTLLRDWILELGQRK